MENIYKYPVGLGAFELELPKGYKILTVQMQGQEAFMWVVVNPENETEKVKFITRGTGHIYEPEMQEYIGTFQMANGALIWHLFKL
ncbi:MAG: hypothetical protein KJI69_04970 [Patescibacteria group bacterium]|nr:hypothetical protein [Patescibacteria group bacterium]